MALRGFEHWQTRLRVLLPSVWLGMLLAVALLATPAPFALLARADAGRVAARMLAGEAYASLLLGVVVLLVERAAARRAAAQSEESQFSAGMVLALVTLACTVAGYFALLPQMDAARAGRGALSFAALHGLSVAFYVAKSGAVGVLAWRAAALSARPPGSS